MADIDNNQNAENTQLPAEFNDSTEMNLADMLSALIESTIAADQKAAEDYLDVLRTYALEPANGSNGHERLKMVDFENIVQIQKIADEPILCAMAVYIGKTRLIDNFIFDPKA